MKHTWRKAAAGLLAAALMTGAVPMHIGYTPITERGFAAYADTVGEGNCGMDGYESSVTWKLDDEGILTISGRGRMKDYWKTGTSAGWEDFADSITGIVIEDGVMNIGSSAFFGLPNLNSVTIPDSVTEIGEGAFSESGLTTFILPKNVTKLKDGVFFGCYNLTSFIIENKYPVKLGNEVFVATHRNLTIYVPDEMYMWYCSEWSEFERKITSSTIKEWPCGNNEYNCIAKLTVGGLLTIRGDGAIANYSPMSAPWYSKYASEITRVVMEDGVYAIGDHAFYGCTALTSVTIPDSIERIGNDAFYGCTALPSVSIPDSVTSIGENAFYGCTALSAVAVPGSVTSIGSGAFYSCSGLTSFAVPDSVTSIGTGAFDFCSNLAEITVDQNNQSYCDADGVLFSKDTKQLIVYPNGKAGTEYVIPDGVTTIGAYAFNDCTSLTSVTIPESAVTIGEAAFYSCSGLKTVVIPETVTEIGDYAFLQCRGLTSLVVKNGTPPALGMDAMKYTADRLRIYVPAASVAEYKLAANWSALDSKIDTYQLADKQYKQTAYRNGMYYTRFVFVMPKSAFAGKSKGVFTVPYNGTNYTHDTTEYYDGVISNGVTFQHVSPESAIFVVTVSSSSDISEDLTCTLDFV